MMIIGVMLVTPSFFIAVYKVLIIVFISGRWPSIYYVIAFRGLGPPHPLSVIM